MARIFIKLNKRFKLPTFSFSTENVSIANAMPHHTPNQIRNLPTNGQIPPHYLLPVQFWPSSNSSTAHLQPHNGPNQCLIIIFHQMVEPLKPSYVAPDVLISNPVSFTCLFLTAHQWEPQTSAYLINAL